MNQFLPPDPAPTARLLGEVAAELARRGHEVAMVGDRAGYRGAKTLLGSRALREGLALLRILLRALAAPRADVMVCLSSPPLLPVAARAARLRHRGARLVHWAMDLYPDVAVALGEVREGSRLHRATAALMNRAYRACDRIVALDAEMAERITAKGGSCASEAPWPPPATGSMPRGGEEPGGSFLWLYSGNLGRAHEWRTLLEAQALLEAGGAAIDLVFQGGGAAEPAARAEAARLGLRRCHWRPYAEAEDLLASLLAAGALVATQRPETAGCLWPSKLALMRLSGRPLVWVGPVTGGVAGELRREGHHVFAPGEASALADRIGDLSRSSRKSAPPDPQEVLARIAKARAEGIARVADLLEAVLA